MSEEKKKKPLSKEELAKIFEAIAKAYEMAGKPIAYATVYNGDEEPEILVPEKEGQPKLEFEDETKH